MRRFIASIICLMLIALPITSLAMNENEYVTRAEFIKNVLEEVETEVEEVEQSSFIDVTDPQYISYIEAATKEGVIEANGEEFKPNDNITKEEAIAVLVKVFGEKNVATKISEDKMNSALTFPDADSISSWTKPYITYALDNNFIKEENIFFYPKMPLTPEQTSAFIADAKDAHKNLFIRDEILVSDLLVEANEKTNEYETYKQKGTMKMNMKMEVEGIPKEELENNPEMSQMLNEGMNMTIDIEVQAQNPDKAYIKEIIKADENQSEIQEEMNQEIEIFMDESTMYTKMMGNDKWIAQDISSLMNQIKSMSNNDPYKMSQLNDEQLGFFKDYAVFEDDAKIDGKDYYVVSIDVDKETYDKYYKKLIEESMNASIELQANNPEISEDPDYNPEQFKQMMQQLIGQMNVEVNYQFYINKETMAYEKMGITQDIYMSMDQLIAMMQAYAEEGEEVPEMSLTMVTHLEGLFDFYDFNEEVSFPEISPKDVVDANQAIPMNIQE